MSDQGIPNRTGGSKFHRNPLCPCNTCKARRREAEALALGIGGPAGPPKKKRGMRYPPDSRGRQPGVIQADADHPLIAPGNKARDRVAQWIALRASEPGIKNIEVARRLGITADNLNHIIYHAVRDGWLKFDNPISRIENELIPKTLDNLSYFLDKKDKSVTIETAKGTVFKDYEKAKGISDAPQTILALKIEAPDPDSIKVMTGRIVGAPKTLEE